MRAHYCGKGKPSEDSCCILHAETPTTPLHAVDLAAEGPPPSLPCPALALCVALLSACLPASRAPSLPLCVPGRLRFALSCSLAAHARTALRLAVVLVHRSWRLKLTHPPPPPTSPPRLRTPRRLCALVRSQVGIREQPAWLARVRRRGRQASFSPSQRFTGGVTKRPNDIPRLCCRRNLPSGDLYTFRAVERGIVVSYWFAPRLISNQGFWRDSALRYQLSSQCHIVLVLLHIHVLYFLAGQMVLDSELR